MGKRSRVTRNIVANYMHGGMGYQRLWIDSGKSICGLLIVYAHELCGNESVDIASTFAVDREYSRILHARSFSH